MALVDFTSYDDIRAALGVSSEEIEDATLSLSLYVNNLAVELDSIDLTLSDTYRALRSSTASKTDAERRFLEIGQLFCTYVVARQLTTALPMFAPKEVTDGKASLSRFAQSPYKDTIKQVMAQYEANKLRLEKAFADLTAGSTPVATPMTYFLAVAPGTDPVTGT